jgi:NADH-quinone oxidoreductase subunit M
VLVLVLGFWPRPLLNLIDKGSLELHRIVDKPGRCADRRDHRAIRTASSRTRRWPRP